MHTTRYRLHKVAALSGLCVVKACSAWRPFNLAYTQWTYFPGKTPQNLRPRGYGYNGDLLPAILGTLSVAPDEKRLCTGWRPGCI